MEIDDTIRAEWMERGTLCRAALAWLREHADSGDAHPIATAVDLLRSWADITPALHSGSIAAHSQAGQITPCRSMMSGGAGHSGESAR